MTAIDEEKYFKNKSHILEFIKRNEEKYKDLVDIFKILVKEDVCLELAVYEMPVEVGQILSKFDVYRSGADYYLEMLKLLEKYSFLEGNCCEIGAGRYPRLAELVASRLKSKKKNLTIYEPAILFSEIENITLVKEHFKKGTDIESFDTLYALFPCEATITVVEKAFEEDKNLILAFCGCDHSTPQHQKWVGDYWAEDFCMDYKEKYKDEVEIINWPTSTEIDLPIMVKKRTNRKSKLVPKAM